MEPDSTVVYPQADLLPSLGPAPFPHLLGVPLDQWFSGYPAQGGVEVQVLRTLGFCHPEACLLPDITPWLGTYSHNPFLGFRPSSVVGSGPCHQTKELQSLEPQ